MARRVRTICGVCIVLGLALVFFVAFASPEMVRWFGFRGAPGQSDPRWMWVTGGSLVGLGLSGLVLMQALRGRHPGATLSISVVVAAALAGLGLVATNMVDIGIDPGFYVYAGGIPPFGWPIVLRFVLGPAFSLLATVASVALLLALLTQLLVGQKTSGPRDKQVSS